MANIKQYNSNSETSVAPKITKGGNMKPLMSVGYTKFQKFVIYSVTFIVDLAFCACVIFSMAWYVDKGVFSEHYWWLFVGCTFSIVLVCCNYGAYAFFKKMLFYGVHIVQENEKHKATQEISLAYTTIYNEENIRFKKSLQKSAKENEEFIRQKKVLANKEGYQIETLSDDFIKQQQRENEVLELGKKQARHFLPETEFVHDYLVDEIDLNELEEKVKKLESKRQEPQYKNHTITKEEETQSKNYLKSNEEEKYSRKQNGNEQELQSKNYLKSNVEEEYSRKLNSNEEETQSKNYLKSNMQEKATEKNEQYKETEKSASTALYEISDEAIEKRLKKLKEEKEKVALKTFEVVSEEDYKIGESIKYAREIESKNNEDKKKENKINN